MSDNSTSTSAAYILLSGLLVLAGFVVSVAVGLPHSNLAVIYLFFFGNAAAWMILFALGLRWYGKPALWLLLVAPFAFYQVAFFYFVMCLLGGLCGHR
ncbi:MAG TPA: hypothetical protein VH913_02305 [Hyphomicrobiaceae bacterium]|jgi:hypothetical protein